MNVKEYKKLARKGTNKYGVAPKEDRTYKGILFGSKGEMIRYVDLLNDPTVSNLKRQVKIVLLPKFKTHNTEHKEISIRVDFTYNRGEVKYIEDFKGKMMKDFLVKWTLLNYLNLGEYDTYCLLSTKDDIKY